MSWSDDIRCLYCDGRLPLYRKITHGQFCSSAHRKKYWEEQENLAVERLRQTHDSLRAYVPAGLDGPDDPRVLETPPAPPVAPAPDPVIAGHMPATALSAHSDLTPRLVAGDPLEYEIEVAPRHPASAASPEFSGQLQLAGLVSVEALKAPRGGATGAMTAFSIPYWSEPKGSQQTILRPQESAQLEPNPAPAGPIGIPVDSSLARTDSSGGAVHIPASQPLFTQTRQAEYASLTLPPVSGELDRMMDQLPHSDRLFALRPFSMLGAAAAPKVVWSTPLPAAATGPVPVEHRCEIPAPVFQGVAGRLPFGPLSTGRALEPAPDVQRPLLFESKGFTTLESLQTPLRPSVNPDQRLPMASGVHYFVKPRIVPPDAAAKTPSLGRSQFSRRAELPPLLLELGDSLGGWMLPPGRKIPFGNTAYVAPATIGPLKVLVLPQPLRTLAIVPVSKLEPAAAKPAIEIVLPPSMGLPQPEAPAASLRTPIDTTPQLDIKPVAGALAIDPWWVHATGFWKHGPRDLKFLLLGIPLLIALALHPSLPKVHLSSGQPTEGISQAVHTQLASFRQSMAERAAVALDEDFRSGLDDWNSRSGDATDWSYDATGFVKPGPLALYAPSTGLTDYQVQFLGMIGKKSLSWVVRAADFDNYYVVKLVERKGGSMPEIGVTRYAVINGKAQDRVDTHVAISARPEMMYLVKMDVKGNDFSMWVQDQMVDSWSEPRLPRGGVGFYSAKGEESRLRWVQITHQYDMLGRLCAYLAPNNFSN